MTECPKENLLSTPYKKDNKCPFDLCNVINFLLFFDLPKIY